MGMLSTWPIVLKFMEQRQAIVNSEVFFNEE